MLITVLLAFLSAMLASVMALPAHEGSVTLRLSNSETHTSHDHTYLINDVGQNLIAAFGDSELSHDNTIMVTDAELTKYPSNVKFDCPLAGSNYLDVIDTLTPDTPSASVKKNGKPIDLQGGHFWCMPH